MNDESEGIWKEAVTLIVKI